MLNVRYANLSRLFADECIVVADDIENLQLRRNPIVSQ